MEQKYLLGIIALAIVAVLGVSMVSANGFGLNKESLTNEEKMQLQEQREDVKAAIESGDYEAWKSIMQDRISRMQDEITEENFNEIVDRHEKRFEFHEAVEKLKASGDYSREDIENLREEYGIQNNGFAKGFKMGKHFNECPLK